MNEELIARTEAIRKKQGHKGKRTFECDKCEDTGLVAATVTLDGKEIMQACTCKRAPKQQRPPAQLPTGIPTPYKDA